MPYTRYPDAGDLTVLLDDMQQAIPAEPERMVLAAIEEFERMTGWRPYLSDCAESVHYFDPPERWRQEPLDLGGGFAEISEIRVRVGYARNGSALVEHRDYELLEYGGDSTSWWGIRFVVDPGNGPRSIKVTGKRGAVEEISEDAFEGILAGAAARSMRMTQTGPGPVHMERLGPRTVEYDNDPCLETATRLEKQFMEAVARHRRMVI